MIIYRSKLFFIITFISFLHFTLVSLAQEDETAIPGLPRNIVPEVTNNEIDDANNNQSENATSVVDNVAVSELPKVSPGWLGILSEEEGGLGWEMWKGTDASFAKNLIELLPVNAPSSAMRSLAKRLLLSRASQPQKKLSSGLSVIGPDGEPLKTKTEDSKLLSLRFSKLAHLGAGDELLELSKEVPPEDMVDRLAKEAINARLLSGETKDVCNEVKSLSRRTNELHWRKVLVVCQLIEGNRDAALLSLELLLAELKTEDTFSSLVYSLADGFSPPVESHIESIYFEILIAVLPGDQLDEQRLKLSPSGKRVVALNIIHPWKLRILSAEKAVAAGVLESRTLGELCNEYKFESNIFARAATESKNMEGHKARSLLYQASLQTTSYVERARFLRLLLDRADQEDLFSAYSATVLPILSTLSPRSDLIWFAATAARAAMAGGNYKLASEWLGFLGKTADLDFEASGSLLRLLPLIAVSGQPLPRPFISSQATDVWSGIPDTLSKKEKQLRASRLLVLLGAMGINVTEGSWRNLINEGNIYVEEIIPSSALRYQLIDAAENNRFAEVVAISLIMLGSDGPSKSSLISLNAVIRAMRNVGLEEDARAIAIEAAIAVTQ